MDHPFQQLDVGSVIAVQVFFKAVHYKITGLSVMADGKKVLGAVCWDLARCAERKVPEHYPKSFCLNGKVRGSFWLKEFDVVEQRPPCCSPLPIKLDAKRRKMVYEPVNGAYTYSDPNVHFMHGIGGQVFSVPKMDKVVTP